MGDPPPGSKCVAHASILATRVCTRCGEPMCETCDFAYPDGVHLCATCVSNPRPVAPSKQGRMGGPAYSMLLAGWATLSALFLILLVAVNPATSEAVTGGIMVFSILLPSLAGMIVAQTSFQDWSHTHSAQLWAAGIWNGLIIISVLLVFVVGMFLGK